METGRAVPVRFNKRRRLLPFFSLTNLVPVLLMSYLCFCIVIVLENALVTQKNADNIKLSRVPQTKRGEKMPSFV
jgi:hypothetical protein